MSTNRSLSPISELQPPDPRVWNSALVQSQAQPATRSYAMANLKSLTLAIVAIGFCMPLRAENWPSWRGPTDLGQSSEVGLPVTWDQKTNVRWKVALPDAGNSTPITWGDRVFITQAHEMTQWPPKVPENYAGGASAGGYAIAQKRSVMCFR